MSRLKSRITGNGRTGGVINTFIGPESARDRLASGMMLRDGSWVGLGGQPPLAQTKGWGNLSFLYFSRR